MGRLNNKVALITGGTTGIGFATAQRFLAEGAQVIITGQDQGRLDAAVAQLEDRVTGIRADVRSPADLDQAVQQIQAKHGGLDVLFVNAGIAKLGAIETVSEADFDEVMGINFKGAYFTIQKMLPLLRDNGAIILNGSANALIGLAGASVYSASKAALHSLARTLGVELIGRGIRVNTLTIGPIETPLHGKLGLPQEAVQGFAQTIAARLPIKRYGQPDEVAQAAVFLASSESSFVLGSELSVDGGILINSL